MTWDLEILLYALGGYLVGSVSTAIITCKLMALPDPRGVGSNNPGATNVLRHGGKKAAIITLLGDMLKGLLPVLVAAQFSQQPLAIAATGLGAFLGHLYPVFFGFKGGKGVATFYGALFGFNWLAGLGALLVWLLMAFAFRYSSLAALVSAASSPLLLWQFSNSTALLTSCSVMTIMLIWRHRSNIRNLLNGDENKIGRKKTKAD